MFFKIKISFHIALVKFAPSIDAHYIWSHSKLNFIGRFTFSIHNFASWLYSKTSKRKKKENHNSFRESCIFVWVNQFKLISILHKPKSVENSISRSSPRVELNFHTYYRHDNMIGYEVLEYKWNQWMFILGFLPPTYFIAIL